MVKASADPMKKLIRNIGLQMTDADREKILDYAHRAFDIASRKNLARKIKLKRLKRLETGPAVIAFAKSFAKALRKYWNELPWQLRSVLSLAFVASLAGGIFMMARKGRVLLASGKRIGRPILQALPFMPRNFVMSDRVIHGFLVTPIGRSLLDTIIDELSHEVRVVEVWDSTLLKPGEES